MQPFTPFLINFGATLARDGRSNRTCSQMKLGQHKYKFKYLAFFIHHCLLYSPRASSPAANSLVGQSANSANWYVMFEYWRWDDVYPYRTLPTRRSVVKIERCVAQAQKNLIREIWKAPASRKEYLHSRKRCRTRKPCIVRCFTKHQDWTMPISIVTLKRLNTLIIYSRRFRRHCNHWQLLEYKNGDSQLAKRAVLAAPPSIH